jgi:hypothetical protein
MTPDSTRNYCRRRLDPSSTNDVSPFRQDLLHLHIFSPSAALLGRGVFRYIGEGDDLSSAGLCPVANSPPSIFLDRLSRAPYID